MAMSPEQKARKAEYQRRYRASNHEDYKSLAAKHNKQARFRRYGITEEDFHAMLEQQGFQCAICSCVTERWCIDHDHGCCPSASGRDYGGYACGKCVRGVICSECNLGLSKFKDDPKTLLAAAAYLRGGA